MEFEDVLVDCCGGLLLVPEINSPATFPFLHRFATPYRINVPKPRTRAEQVLIIVCVNGSFLYEFLASMPGWRSRFDLVCAFISDAWLPKIELDKPQWKLRLTRQHRTCSSIDHVFIPLTGSIGEIQEYYGVPVSFLPLACDVAKFGSNQSNRPIDLNAYGRQDQKHRKILEEFYNAPTSSRMFYHTNHMMIGKVYDLYAHRRMFWNILQWSRITFAYDALRANEYGRFRISFVGQRWFEGITAGCLIVGHKPTCPEMNELFSWEDATVEVPEDDNELIPWLEGLLTDNERLGAAHLRNYSHALARHDWRHRVATMHDSLRLPYPEQLEEQLTLIERKSSKLA